MSFIPDIQRLLPQDADAERGLLCSFLLSPRDVGNYCAERHICAAHFHIPAHAIIFGLLFELWAEVKPFDFVTLTSALRDRGLLDSVGGPAAITELWGFLPTHYLAPQHAEILEDKRVLRELAIVCTEYAARSYDEQDDAGNLLLAAQNAVAGILSAGRPQPKSFKTLLMETLDSIERGDDATADVLSGLESLDRLVKMRRGNFIVIGGEAKSGKTALAGTILTNAAVRQGKRVAAFSLEMSDVEMVKRMIACAGRVNVGLIGREPSEYDLQGVTRGATALHTADIEIVSELFDLGAIVARARQLHAQRPLDLIVLDYIQLVEFSTGRKGETRQEIVAQISRTCKRVAGELSCVVIGLSQLNDEGKLRESRAIGQDANAVIAVEKDEDGGRALRVVVQRNGPSNESAAVQWLPQFTKFESK